MGIHRILASFENILVETLENTAFALRMERRELNIRRSDDEMIDEFLSFAETSSDPKLAREFASRARALIASHSTMRNRSA